MNENKYDLTCDVLQEDKWDISLTTQLNEMCRFQCWLAMQYTVVANDTDRITVDTWKPGDNSFTVQRFKLVELTAVHDACNHLDKSW